MYLNFKSVNRINIFNDFAKKHIYLQNSYLHFCKIILHYVGNICANVAELADAQVSGTCGATR